MSNPGRIVERGGESIESVGERRLVAEEAMLASIGESTKDAFELDGIGAGLGPLGVERFEDIVADEALSWGWRNRRFQAAIAS